MKLKANKKLKSFSLAEILIVLVVIGILIMLVIPNQSGVASKTKALEAKQELRMIHNLETAYFLQYSKYTSDLKQLNYVPHISIEKGGNAYYSLEVVSASKTDYKAVATAVQDFNGDGKFNTWEISKDGKLLETQSD